MAGAPQGNQNARKENRWITSALKRELLQFEADGVPKGEALSKIAQMAIMQAIAGDKDARNFVADRIDGKPTNAVELSGPEGEELRLGIVSLVRPG